MIAWLALTLLAVAAAVAVTIPLVRRHDARRAAGASPAVRPARDPAMRWGLGLAALGLAAAGLIVLVARSGPVAPTPPPPAAAGPHQGDGVERMIGQLEERLKARPGDAEGWRMLGWSYSRTGRFKDSAVAYGRAAALEPANGDYLSAEGEAMVQAAGGMVQPDARAVFERALKASPADPRARYFLAVGKDQAGDRAGALADWRALLASAPPGAPWTAEVRDLVETLGGKDAKAP